MKVEKMKWITREDVKASPRKVFLFGDNLERWGLGGQAKEMRGEPNAVGIITKLTPSNHAAAFFTDEDDVISLINRDIETAIDKALELGINSPDGAVIVIPSDGIGTGLAELDKRAPKTFAYLQQRLAELEKE